jgi:hypothetical protein
METFNEWYKELRRVASKQGVGWLVHDNKGSYREFYEDGLSPADALEEEIYSARLNT